MSEIKMPKDRIKFKATIPPVKTAIGIGGGDGEAIDLKLQIFGEDVENSFVNDLMEKRGERLIVILEKYDPSKHTDF